MSVSRSTYDTEYLVVTDHVGTVLAVVHPNSDTELLRRTYDAFGYMLTEEGDFEMPLGFAGGVMDRDTGLVNFMFRDYDPMLGRFTARDPLLLKGGSPNMYAYTFNDPVNMRDPLGLQCISASSIESITPGLDVCASWDGASACSKVAAKPRFGLSMSLLGQPKKGANFVQGVRSGVAQYAGLKDTAPSAFGTMDVSPDAWVEAKRCNSRLDSDFSIRDSFAHTELAGLNYEAIQSTLSNRERGHSFVDDLQDLTRSQPAQTGVSPHDATGQGSCSVDASC
ncbi:MAG: hypothetical protein CML43_16960 [Rhodobacteraceae bacterium]|nr:hypothetical protein [Paracoccaceae bacterium]